MFVIYCKSGCPDCVRAKKLLRREECIAINCDEILQQDRDAFIEDMKRRTGLGVIIFPLIFIDDDYLGDIDELISYITFKMDDDDF